MKIKYIYTMEFHMAIKKYEICRKMSGTGKYYK